jgi:hypothetical protein
MHPDKVSRINGWGVVLRFVHPAMFALVSSLILYILAGNKSDLAGLKDDLQQAKIESKSNFDKLELTAKFNFDQIHTQLSNHLTHHQALDKELYERLTSVETLLKMHGGE